MIYKKWYIKKLGYGYIVFSNFILVWLKFKLILYVYVYFLTTMMMKITYVVLSVLIVLFVLRLAWSYFGTRSIEKPATVSSRMLEGGVELREVAGMIQATVLVEWNQRQALNNGFRQLAWYIFGGNAKKQSVAMTAPVAVTKEEDSQPIAMTAPVALQVSDAGQYRVSFMMPQSFTLDALPIPKDENISFVSLPARSYYVWKFSGHANFVRSNKQLVLFKEALRSQDITTNETPILNQYNDPLTIRFMRKNEWRIAVE